MKAGLIALGVVVALVALLALLMHSATPSPEQAQATGNFFSEQQKMMREALDMAKEAQQLQRQHMRDMQRMAEMEYETMPAYATEEYNR